MIDKQHAQARKGIFLIDASGGFAKDGPKNRLRAQDIHRIVDTWRKRLDVPGYARMVSAAEIEKNEFNLNLTRYIDSQAREDLQDIAGHLLGGIPLADVDALGAYWAVCPSLRRTLFAPLRKGYVQLAVDKGAIRSTILEHKEFVAFVRGQEAHFATWRQRASKSLRQLERACQPKDVIAELSEGLLEHYRGQPLLDAYDVYQKLMEYWVETMQDDAYLISAAGWIEGVVPREILQVKDKNGKLVWPETHDFTSGRRRFRSDLVPGELLIAKFLMPQQSRLEKAKLQLDRVEQLMEEQRNEHADEGGLLEDVVEIDGDNSKITAKAVKAWLRENADDESTAEERVAVAGYAALQAQQASLKSAAKEATAELHASMARRYRDLTSEDIRKLVVDSKWLETLARDVRGEFERIGQRLTERCGELAERYEAPLPEIARRVEDLEGKVRSHLEKMGFAW